MPADEALYERDDGVQGETWGARSPRVTTSTVITSRTRVILHPPPSGVPLRPSWGESTTAGMAAKPGLAVVRRKGIGRHRAVTETAGFFIIHIARESRREVAEVDGELFSIAAGFQLR